LKPRFFKRLKKNFESRCADFSIQKKTSAGSIFTMKQTKDCLINAIKKRISFDEYKNEEQEKIQRLKLNCNFFAIICAPHHLHSRICPNKH
jgi:hypothetical protein